MSILERSPSSPIPFQLRPDTFIFACLLLLSIIFFSCSKKSDEFEHDGDVVYVNTGKGTKYVGSEKCAPCHQGIYESYLKAEMGRSMSKVSHENVVEDNPQAEAVYDSAKNFFYQMVRRGNRFYQREYRLDTKGKVIHERLMEAEYVIGSGNNLRMYFHDENGMLYELPLTWYVHKKQWDRGRASRTTRIRSARALSGRGRGRVCSP